MMRRISVANIILVHRKLIDQTGGSHGVRDINLVDSAVSRAFAINLFDYRIFYRKNSPERTGYI